MFQFPHRCICLTITWDPIIEYINVIKLNQRIDTTDEFKESSSQLLDSIHFYICSIQKKKENIPSVHNSSYL